MADRGPLQIQLTFAANGHKVAKVLGRIATTFVLKSSNFELELAVSDWLQAGQCLPGGFAGVGTLASFLHRESV